MTPQFHFVRAACTCAVGHHRRAGKCRTAPSLSESIHSTACDEAIAQAIVIAVSQVQSVSHFVNRFFSHSLAKQFLIGWKTVKLLPQAVVAESSARMDHPSGLRPKTKVRIGI